MKGEVCDEIMKIRKKRWKKREDEYQEQPQEQEKMGTVMAMKEKGHKTMKEKHTRDDQENGERKEEETKKMRC